jgi:membrane fusion protein (multidrug efflux system)
VLGIRSTLKIAVSLIMIGGLGTMSYEVFYWFTHVYEDDANVRTELTNISAQINGRISKVLVKEGSEVKKGQILVALDDADVLLEIEALETELRLEKAQRSRLMSERAAFEIELTSKLETQKKKILAIEFDHKAVQDRLTLARKNMSRVKYLFNKNLTSEDKLHSEQDKVLILEGQLSLLRANVAVASKELEQIEAARTNLDVIDEKLKISDLEQDRTRNEIDQQRVILGYRHIESPINGVIDRIHKYSGEYVEDGVDILVLHDRNLFWVEANVDESQVRHLKVGQEVLIDLDAYPFQDFYGKVQRIGSITAGQIGLGNDGGNRFGRAIERVPVHISLDTPPPNLTPGMRAQVNIRLYENIPLW